MNLEYTMQKNYDNCPNTLTNDSFDIKSENESIDFLGNKFNFIKNPETIDDISSKNIYYITNLKKTFNSNSNNIQHVLSSNIKKKFKIYLRKKRGRKETKLIVDQKNVKVHNKLYDDNIIRKCQVGYINFIIDFMNILCNKFNLNLSFVPIDYTFKKNVKKNNINTLVSQTIEKIIINNISPKFTSKKKNINIENCEIIKRMGITDLINILNKRYLFFFDKIYYKSLRKFNLKQFYLSDVEIELPDSVKLYKDVLKKNKNDNDFNEYEKKMDEIVKKYFLPKVNKYFFKCEK